MRSALTTIWSPEDVELCARLAAQHDPIPAAPAALAPVVDITTGEVIA